MREEKKLLLDEIKQKVEASNAFLVAKYESLDSQEIYSFRDALAKKSSEMEVVKKRVFLKALEECGYSYKVENLNGHIAVIFIKGDLVDAAKVVFEFAETTNKLDVISGEIDRKSYNKEDVLTLSKLPSLNVLRAQFLGLLEAPMVQTVSVIDSLLTSVIFTLEEKK